MRGIEKLHPELRVIAEEFCRRCLGAGLNVLVTDTLRTKTEQTALYAQGRTEPGSIVTRCKYPNSPHCWGVAFDFCRNEKGREYVNTDGFFERCGAIGKALGLTWGGDFKSFVDRPHLELTKYMPSASCKWLIATYGTPERFMATWEKEEIDMEEMKKAVVAELAERDEIQAQAAQRVSPWAKESWDKAVAAGVFDGTRPGGTLTREQAAVVLDRLGLLKGGAV